jgi:hypothetical protein
MRHGEASRDIVQWLSWHLPRVPELIFYDNAAQFAEFAIAKDAGEYGEGQIMYVLAWDSVVGPVGEEGEAGG